MGRMSYAAFCVMEGWMHWLYGFCSFKVMKKDCLGGSTADQCLMRLIYFIA